MRKYFNNKFIVKALIVLSLLALPTHTFACWDDYSDDDWDGWYDGYGDYDSYDWWGDDDGSSDSDDDSSIDYGHDDDGNITGDIDEVVVTPDNDDSSTDWMWGQDTDDWDDSNDDDSDYWSFSGTGSSSSSNNDDSDCLGAVCVVCGKFTKLTQGSACDMCKGHPCETYANILKKVLNTEGGYSNRSADKGGPTNHGIAWKTWISYSESVLGISPTLDNLKALTTSNADRIYKAQYWDKNLIGNIEDSDLRYFILDFVVNSGGAGYVIQVTLNAMDDSLNLTVDGKVGNQTINAINKMNASQLYTNLIQARRNYLERIIEKSVNNYMLKHPDYTTEDLYKYTNLGNEKGWNNRINSFQSKPNNKSNVNCDD